MPAPRVRRTAAPLLALLALLAAGGACFCLPPRPPPRAFSSSITGAVHVTGVTGLAAAADRHAVVQARVDVCLADAPVRAAAATRGLDVTGGRRDAPADDHARADDYDAPAWRPGEVIVMHAPGVFGGDRDDDAAVAHAVDAMIGRAALPVSARVVRCSFARFCLVELRDARSDALLDHEATRAAAAALHEHRVGGVTVVTRNGIKRGFFLPDDRLFDLQWNLDRIHMRAAWDVEQGDDGVVVAVVDSGAFIAQTDLQARWARDNQGRVIGTDMVSAGGGDLDGVNGRDTDPEDPGDNAFGAGAHSWHGTHIAGIIAAETDNGEGVAGVTRHGVVEPVRVLGDRLQGSDADIFDGIAWALGQHVEGSPDNPLPAKLVNLSLGGGALDAQEQEAWNELVAAALALPTKPILVAAAGNSDEDAANILPANVPGMITVGAIGFLGTRTSYSNFGAVVDVMAPGGELDTDLNGDAQPDAILSSVNPDFDWRIGTSMAAPHVTGVAALLVAQSPALDQSSIEALLTQSADAAGRCNEGCGAGTLDAVAALVLNGGVAQPQALLGSDVARVFFPTGVQLVNANALNLGDTALSFTTEIVGAQAQLFHVDPPSSSAAAVSSGAAARVPLSITLARGAFEAGNATLKITTTDVTPAQEVDVDLSFTDDPNRAPRALETVEVAAFRTRDDGTLETVAKTVTTKDEGFAYTLADLPAGDYQVFAIGDDNRDGVFEANLESFGAYPRRDAPEDVHLDDDQAAAGVDFAIDAAFITDVVGGVGAPCSDDNDCNFAGDALCVTSFTGGYCSRLCDADGACGDNGTCAPVTCTDADGTEHPCDVCLVRCASDAQCRFDDGFACILSACFPPDLPP